MEVWDSNSNGFVRIACASVLCLLSCRTLELSVSSWRLLESRSAFLSFLPSCLWWENFTSTRFDLLVNLESSHSIHKFIHVFFFRSFIVNVHFLHRIQHFELVLLFRWSHKLIGIWLFVLIGDFPFSVFNNSSWVFGYSVVKQRFRFILRENCWRVVRMEEGIERGGFYVTDSYS